MMKRRKFFDRFSVKILAFIGCLALSSCGELDNAMLENEQPLPVQLSVSLADNGYTSDGELIPMNTRSGNDSYAVAKVVRHSLFILKKAGNDWVVEDIRGDVIKPLTNKLLRLGESLSLTESSKEIVLLPGSYWFVLYLNQQPLIGVGAIYPEDSKKIVTDGSRPLADFFLAQAYLEIEKTNDLTLTPEKEKKVELKLNRNSSLIRFVLEGEDWTEFNDPTVTCQLEGETCVGLDILGNPVMGNWETMNPIKDFYVDIKVFSPNSNYIINGKNYYFSAHAKNNNNLSLFAIDDHKREVTLIITNIGNSDENAFEGRHEVTIPISKNHITTVLIRKDPLNKKNIITEVNPTMFSDGWITDYPPFNYIELNN